MNNERIQEIKRRWQAEMDAFQNHDIAYLLSKVERLQEENKFMKETLETMAESKDEWYVFRTPMQEYARTALSHLKGE